MSSTFASEKSRVEQFAEEDSTYKMTDREFRIIRDWLLEKTGISLRDAKKQMVCSRLSKRLRHYGISNFSDYFDFAVSDNVSETQELINCLTTNKTDFFREPHHFNFLKSTLFPKIRSGSSEKRLRIWSAGCSTGEEPFTIAMTVRDSFPENSGWDCRILATDIDTEVLKNASNGVYSDDRISDVPPDCKRKYFLRGTGEKRHLVCVRNNIREMISFRQLNFMDEQWPVHGSFDVIFCRNVIIYFNQDVQDRLIHHFISLLKPGGYLIMGHSENLLRLSEFIEPVGQTIYRSRKGNHRDTPSSDTVTPFKKRSSLSAPVSDDESVPQHTLIIGDVFATSKPAMLKTLLGSCVSACIFDPETGIGGMNHFSLPGGTSQDVSTRYGIHAMELLINEVMKQGGDRYRLKAKIFGGAHVLNIRGDSLDIGAQNSDFVRKFLNREGIPIVAERMGGEVGTRIFFYPHTGKVYIRPLEGEILHNVVSDEEKYVENCHSQTRRKPPSVVLFGDPPK